MSNEIMKLCRLCLVKDQANVSIFAEQNDRQIFVKITACLPIRVSKDDGLPKKICDSCLSKLDLLYQFWNTTVNAEKQLLSWLGETCVETEFKLISENLPVQAELHSIKQEELDPFESVPENTHENFISHPIQSLTNTYFEELVGFRESQTIEDEGFQSNNLRKINRDYSGCTPAKRRKQLALNDNGKCKEEEVYRPSIATVIVKSEKDNENMEAEDVNMNPEQMGFTTNEIHDQGQPELCGMQKQEILKHPCPSTFAEHQVHQPYTNRKIIEKPYKTNTSKLNDPATFKHTGEKQIRCNLCNFRCMEAETLKRHMMIHIGEKLFKCDLCDYRCRTFQDLERHMLTHAGENRDKPLKCHLCDYKCSFSAYLKKHMLTHTGEKPFKCDLCDYKCNQSWSLKRHMIRHTSKKPLKSKKKSSRKS